MQTPTTKALTMTDLAEQIIAVAHDHNLAITSLKLQKVMYFTLQTTLNRQLLSFNELVDLYDTPFYVWRYGPIEPRIYAQFKIYGSDAITELVEYHDRLKSLDAVILQLLTQNSFDLVEKSCQEAFWQARHTEIKHWRSDVAYSLADILTGQWQRQ